MNLIFLTSKVTPPLVLIFEQTHNMEYRRCYKLYFFYFHPITSGGKHIVLIYEPLSKI